jgi:hypothetical protein
MAEMSRSFPSLPMKEVERLIQGFDFVDDTRWSRNLRAWVRESLLPLYRNLARPE